MTLCNSQGAQSAARRISATTLGLCLAFGATGCGGDESENDSAASDEATVVGETDGRLQLTEGVDYKMRTGGDAVGTVQIAADEEGEEPAVVITVSEGKDSEEEHTASLGDTVDIGDDIWRVSEIGMSESESQPGSATLVREEN
ncbi:hypothetical protein F4561_003946 [Lipingzhangella halophila]|uniref:Uncharacterized protein n=1 Tax=Lipingzhangella halophila TaxID=1783352 RepID=A0A7W7RJL3_9ACTN|nr:DUF6406 domain-containing protein [Lipingzhangella halophila]MBB4933126.1 hypothetical protein [Lipingzhangella halophila]